MLYSTVEISKRHSYDNNFTVIHTELPHHRHEEPSFPNSIGFYHYPRKLGKEKAFKILRDKMIKDRKNLIDKLSSEVEELVNLNKNEIMV